jgi:hypothetical protein
MYRGNHVIQPGQNLVGKIEHAVGPHLDFGTLPQADAGNPGLDFLNFPALLLEPLRRQAAGDAEALGVVSQAVLIPWPGQPGPSLDSVPAVAQVGGSELHP